jgi:hypothetical protein
MMKKTGNFPLSHIYGRISVIPLYIPLTSTISLCFSKMSEYYLLNNLIRMLSYKLPILSRKSQLSLLGIVVVVLGLCVTIIISRQQQNILQHAAADTVAVNVDNAKPHQTMEGFGTTNLNLWYGGQTGSSITDDQRKRAIEAVYNQVKINTGQIDRDLLEAPTPDYATRGNDNSDPNNINWSGFQGEGVDKAKSLLIDLASPYGFNDYLISAKVTTRWGMDWMQSIKSSNYQLYLQEVAAHGSLIFIGVL